ncbi:DnaB-like helicase C-terminal domain-containing protein [Crateriforma conspicua]|uniref:DnaB-like helicase C-terminal domain-containing protein n=1 Tax=Crateriforma conspicua TaxID=2527996 RepID=UPI001188A152|nr:DnaB-like helicase C-terminal domain-containing protein [Crateriforma conspicua]QDV63791.1 Replicative DNA helicase [Crateriforma conspicua]
MTAANFIRCDRLFDDWQDDVLHGEPPRRYDIGPGLEHVRLGPGTVSLLGGSPGMGKTAFAMQCVVSAMTADASLRACVCNVEMPPERLLERQLSRLSGVGLDYIQSRQLGERQRDKLDAAFDLIDDIADRLVFVRAPMTLENVAAAADDIDAELVVLDYIQRIRPVGRHDDKRGSVDATMDSIRRFADAGCCVLALSAVGRSKDAKGRTSYAGDGLSLASFRESSELEYGADDAYLLVPAKDAEQDADDAVIDVTLRQLKSRYGQPTDCDLTFDRSVQSFEPTEPPMTEEHRQLRDAIAGLWGEE